ncbi:hypothetical protein ACN27E_21105 [Mycobacterium sp. WMMD1722]|uniref:hypothetical protein n=1 Tax=Mycobacterium sp. WMMD1722 TaxID=3404117 RepID=UPI003BF45E2D
MAAHPLDEDLQVGRYRLDVIAVDVEEAVHFAGGLICDQSLAGWDVNVVTRTRGGEHALPILGAAAARELPANDAALYQTLAVSAAAISTDDAVRERVLAGSAADATDILVWDAQRSVAVPAVFETIEHDVSAAARAYRQQALRALGVERECGAIEVFLGRRQPARVAAGAAGQAVRSRV